MGLTKGGLRKDEILDLADRCFSASKTAQYLMLKDFKRRLFGKQNTLVRISGVGERKPARLVDLPHGFFDFLQAFPVIRGIEQIVISNIRLVAHLEGAYIPSTRVLPKLLNIEVMKEAVTLLWA
jgi:hypothetical protein